MTGLQVLRNNQPAQPPVVVDNVPNNVRRINFKAENQQDNFVRSNQSTLPRNMVNPQQVQMLRMMEAQQKEQKKQKWKQNLSWGVGIAAGLAIIGSLFLTHRSMAGDPADLELIKKIKEKLPKVKDLSIKQQIEAELRMNAHERNLYRAENLLKLDELAQDTSGRTKTSIEKLKENFQKFIIGLEDVKNSMITSVKKANYNIEHGIADNKPTIIILDGAPGTSKTSFAKCYADAAGLYYKKVPCGGISDAQTILGFKRTYMGSVSGVISEAQVESGSKKICYCLDEIDRVQKKEVLDALLAPFEENAIFIDQYYGVPIDLSQSTFILTTNDVTRLPEALKNRANIIHINDYTLKDKAAIAKLKLGLRLAKDKAEQYIKEIDESIYENIAQRTNDKGGRQVDLLTEELMSAIKGMQQDGQCSVDKKLTIDKKFLDKIELGKNMKEAAKLESERANVAWQRQNL